MATNLAVDSALIERARIAGGKATKRAAVEEALHEYVQHRKQQGILKLFGTVDYEPGHDYKRQRRVR